MTTSASGHFSARFNANRTSVTALRKCLHTCTLKRAHSLPRSVLCSSTTDAYNIIYIYMMGIYKRDTHLPPTGPTDKSSLGLSLSRASVSTRTRYDIILLYRNAVIAGGRSCVTTRTARYDDDGSVTSASRRFVVK